MFGYIKNKYNLEPEYVLEKFKKKNTLLYFAETIGSPVYLLPENLEIFYNSRGKKFWYNVKRQERMFVKEFGKLEFKVVRNEEEMKHYLPYIFKLFNEKWKSQYISSSWKSESGFEKYAIALIELAKNNEAELVVLENNRECLAYAYCLKQNRAYYFYQHTTTIREEFRKYSLGKIFLIKLLEYVIELNKYAIFDFMTGVTPYKIEWAQKVQKVYYKVEEKKNVRGYLRFIKRIILCNIRFYIIRSNYLKKALRRVLNFIVSLGE